jgi:hypothetical protein
MDFNNNNEHGFPDPTVSPEDNTPDIMPTGGQNSVNLDRNSYNIGTEDPFNYNPNNPQAQQQQYGQQTTYSDPKPGYQVPPPAGFAKPSEGGFGGSQFAYGQPYRNYPTGLATASLVLGVVSIVFCIVFTFIVPLLILPILGIILGIVYKTKKYPVARGTSTAGIICSSIGLIIPIIIYVIIFSFIMNLGTYIDEYKAADPAGFAQIQQQIADEVEPLLDQYPEAREELERYVEQYPVFGELFEDVLD